MEIRICKDRYELGKSAAEFTANEINKAIKEKGVARIALASMAKIGVNSTSTPQEPSIMDARPI